MRWLLLLLLPAAAQAAPERWMVLPVAGTPPPRDPTLLRLTRELSEALHQAHPSADFMVISRDRRDAWCTHEGRECPPELASHLEADRVVSLVLADDYSALTVRVFRAPRGLLHELTLPCTWTDGRPRCDTEPLRDKLQTASAALDPAVVEQNFTALRGQLQRCLSLGAAQTAAVSFRVKPHGRVADVRIEPRALQNEKPYACVARAIEGMTLPPFSGPTSPPFRFSLSP